MLNYLNLLYFHRGVSVNITENDHNGYSIKCKANNLTFGPTSTGMNEDNSNNAANDDVDTSIASNPFMGQEAVKDNGLAEEKDDDDKLPSAGLAPVRPLDASDNSIKRSESVENIKLDPCKNVLPNSKVSTKMTG